MSYARINLAQQAMKQSLLWSTIQFMEQKDVLDVVRKLMNPMFTCHFTLQNICVVRHQSIVRS